MFSTHRFDSSLGTSDDIILFFNEIQPEVEQCITEELANCGTVKWSVVLKTTLTRETHPDTEDIPNYSRSNDIIQLIAHTLTDNINLAFSKNTEIFENFLQAGSG